MTPLVGLGLAGAGLVAGCVNVIVGSGSLLTFPTLLAFGYSPVVANVTNTVGLVPGTASGLVGYRRELVGQRERVLRLGLASLLGGVAGAILLLTLPASAFQAIVPVLIALALVLVVAQPRLARWMAKRRPDRPANGGPLLWLGIFGAGIYGGYFGAAQGIMLIAMMSISINDDMQRLNAAKNVLNGVVNAVAAIIFICVSHVSWPAAGLLAAGAVIGGQIGARVGRKLPPAALRVLIVCVGVAAMVKILA
jgi:uncharacterized membrane protein YfcA